MHLLKKFKIAASSLAIISLLVVVTSSCDEDELTKQQVEVNPEERTFSVDSSAFNNTKTTNETVVILDTLISVNVAEVLEEKENGYSMENLSNGNLIGAELFPNDPFEPENPFHFMSGATLKVGNEGEEPVVVAQITEIDEGSNEIVFETFEENIMQYLETDPLHLVLAVDRHGPMKTGMMEFSLNNTYEVEVELF